MKGARLSGGVKIGLEIHCQLTALETKLFCACSSDYREKEPNELICPVCFGLPGTLPVLNGRALEYALRIGIALDCEIPTKTLFFRKNYFYPDLPKNFQITQYDKAGGVAVASDGQMKVEGKSVRIRRIQLEEDPGKLTYEGTIEKSTYSLVDYNRAGVALVEIVTEPDFESAKEAKIFLERLRSMVEALGVSNGELEGAMRCDANISVAGGSRVEIKNISSFKEVEKALNYEILRQSTFSGEGAANPTETRHWDERRSITISLRVKEEEQDYRYFPEPDIPVISVTREYVAKVKASMPEVPEARARRYVKRYGIAAQTAGELVRAPVLSSFFEQTVKLSVDPQEVANWLLGEFREQIQASTDRKDRKTVTPQRLAELVEMIKQSKLTRMQAKELFREMLTTGQSAPQLVGTMHISILADEDAMAPLIEKVISKDAALQQEAKNNPKAFNYLIGQVLKLEPRAEPKLVAKMIRMRLKG